LRIPDVSWCWVSSADNHGTDAAQGPEPGNILGGGDKLGRGIRSGRDICTYYSLSANAVSSTFSGTLKIVTTNTLGEAINSGWFGRARWKTIVLRFRKPDSPEGFLLGVAAVAASCVIVIVLGWVIGWRLPTWLLAFYGMLTSLVILVGEHFRSRVFERVADDSRTHVELVIGGDSLDEFLRVRTTNAAPANQGEECRGLYCASARVAKRVLDVIGATSLLLFISPTFVAIFLLIKLESAGPVLCRVQRHDIKGNPIRLLRFRSLKDGQITRVGRFLTRTSLVELPQLINVLNGELSLVGFPPFPAAKAEALLEAEVIDITRSMPDIRCGLSGINQVSLRNYGSITELVRNEAAYVANWSVWMDIKILLRTVLMVFQSAARY
jgi:lipopolysaccharide/colanic/teichoic acid biosynthesis glycosyltransferase